MSAIWGMIDFHRQSVSTALADKMEAPYHSYKIEEYKRYVAGDAFFGYGGQYFTKEAMKEIQPITDNMEQILFAADVVLDNREELFDRLGIKDEKRDEIADGTLMYQVLKRFGRKSLTMFLGTYAFAYYDRDKKELLLAADAVASRSLYYSCCLGKVYFSTLIKPILNLREEVKEWNYRFLSDYLALDSFTLYTEAEETPYKNLYKVAPGQAVTIDEWGIYKENYWEPPVYTKPDKKSDKEYKEEFIQLFETCVAAVMRSAEKTGILLSGGLDSTAVACLAAPKLRDRGEVLYSYTSVPEQNYRSDFSPYYITNEQGLVEITKKHLGNLSCTYLDLPGVNSYDGALEFMKKYELPYKSLQNIRWLNEAACRARSDGCRILLSGQYGNATISLGDFETHFYTLLRKGDLLTLMKEINAFHRVHRYSRKKVIVSLIRSLRTDLSRKSFDYSDMFEGVYVKPELLSKYRTVERLKDNFYFTRKGVSFTFESFRPLMFNKNALVQIGEFETHLSLDTGILERDPTRDRRLIEFCMKLPENQFVYKGVERRLAREYLADFMPKEITQDTKHRGLQSADMIERLSKDWDHIYQDCAEILEDDMAGTLLNIPKLKNQLEQYRKELPRGDMFGISKLLYSILLARYLKCM